MQGFFIYIFFSIVCGIVAQDSWNRNVDLLCLFFEYGNHLSTSWNTLCIGFSSDLYLLVCGYGRNFKPYIILRGGSF